MRPMTSTTARSPKRSTKGLYVASLTLRAVSSSVGQNLLRGGQFVMGERPETVTAQVQLGRGHCDHSRKRQCQRRTGHDGLRLHGCPPSNKRLSAMTQSRKLVIPGRAQRGGPETITTVAGHVASPVRALGSGGYGFRARRVAATRNDASDLRCRMSDGSSKDAKARHRACMSVESVPLPNPHADL